MKKRIFILFFLSCNIVFAQFVPSRFWIKFTDKSGSPYTIADPSAYLSQRAIDRRTKQYIAIQENDIPVDTTYIRIVLNTGVTLLNRSKWFNAVVVKTVDTNIITTIRNFPFVVGAKPVGKIKWTFNDASPLPPSFKTNHANAANSLDYGPAYNQIDMIGGICLHDNGYTGEGMQIAVIDAGFINADTLHVFDSINLSGRVLGTRNFAYTDPSVYKYDSHGTAVLSTMAGNWPGQLVGTAPASSYYLLLSEQGGSEYAVEEDNWVAAAEYADSAGADVINTSLGYNTFDYSPENYTYADMNGHTAHITIAADIAVSKGMIVVCGAGNEGGGSWQHITAPADADSIIAVGAVDGNRNYVYFSSIGPTYDGRVKPDVCAQGSGTIIAASNGAITAGNGTSFAAPIIAGMAACLWQANPTKRNTEVIDAIKKSSSLYYNPNNQLGYGIPNFCIASSLLKGTDPKYFQEDSLVSLTPSPFSNIIDGIFYAATTEVLKIELHDVTGKLVLQEEKSMWGNNYNNFKISGLDFLGAGIYMITISGDNKGYKQKVLKL